jgi:hypothetical protein
MKFTELNPNLSNGDGWIGISIRSQHFYANFGHLVYIKSDGSLVYARPSDDKGNYDDIELGRVRDFDISQWVTFQIRFDDNILRISIGGISKEFTISDKNEVPFCYNAGMVRFQTYKSKACIQSIIADFP